MTPTTNTAPQARPSTVARRGLALVSALAALVISPFATADWSLLNMTEGVTPISQTAYDLHMLILWICVAIGVVVFGVMFYSIFMHRKSRGAKAATFHHSTKAEIAWTIVPCIILVVMAVPATKGLVQMEDTSNAEITVKVTGYQWKWQYEYLGTDVSFYSDLASTSRAAINGDPSSVDNYLLEVDNPLVIPVNKKVRILLTSNDVIHAWWIPDFGMKKDAIPGFINEMWIRAEKTGTYRGQCAELCGRDHGFMPIVTEVKTQADYDAWLASMNKGNASASSGQPVSSDVITAAAKQ